MLWSRDDSIAGLAATEGGAVSLFLEVCGSNLWCFTKYIIVL